MNTDRDCECEADYGVFGDREICDCCKRAELEDLIRQTKILLKQKPQHKRRRKLSAADVMLASMGYTSVLDQKN